MKGVKPEWENLARRKCDNCGKNYKPFRPQKKDEFGFCSDNCRKEFHKHGGAYAKLKPIITQEVKRRVRECNPAEETRIAGLEARLLTLEHFMERLRTL